MSARDLDLALPSGRLRARDHGGDERSLALCVPGLSANARWFEALAVALGESARVVALDLRGRGHSQVTPPGTYGWEAHARDIFAAADALGAERFALIGHSMGAFVAMQAAALDERNRIGRLALIDGLGVPHPDAVAAIVRGLGRLEGAFASTGEYVAAIREAGLAKPWSAFWEGCYRYEIADVPGGVAARTSRDAVAEDLAFGAAHDVRALWPSLTMPVLALRASVPLAGDKGFIVTAADRDAFARAVARASVVEIPANHFGIVAHADTAAAIARFLAVESVAR